MSNSDNNEWEMTRANFPRPKDDNFSLEEDPFARNTPPPKDDWAMTRVKAVKNNEPKYDSFDQTKPNFPRPQNNDWSIPQKPQTNDDWDKTQANIVIPPNSIPKSSSDDWSMTQTNIAIPPQNSPTNLENTIYGFSPQKTNFGKTETNFDVSPIVQNQSYTPESIPQKMEQTSSNNDATKWIYFLAGAFTMFVFVAIFLGIIYLLFLFKQ